jgi:hypothetical protein
MQTRRPIAQLLEPLTGGLPVPWLAKAGSAFVALGLLIDLAAHALAHPGHDQLAGAFPMEEHLAHLVVVIGMALVLGGIVVDGVHAQRRQGRQKVTVRHAVR